MSTPPPRTFADAIGALRSIVGAPATPEGWFAIIDTVDALDGVELAKALDYLEGVLGAWTPDTTTPWASTPPDTLKDHGFAWMDPLERELRQAPSAWLERAFSSDASPRMRLATGANLRAFHGTLGSRRLQRGLSKDTLSNLRSLHLGHSSPTSKTALSRFAAATATANLAHLSIADFRHEQLPALDAPGHLEPTHLGLHGSPRVQVGTRDGVFDPAVLARFLDAPWFRRVRTLSLSVDAHPVFAHLRAARLWRDLHTIELVGTFSSFRHYGSSRFHMTYARTPRCHTLRLVNPHFPDTRADLALAMEASPAGVTHLDLSGWLPPLAGASLAERERLNPSFARVRSELRIRLPVSPLLEHIDEVTLGHWHTDTFADDLEHHGTRVIG